MLYILWIDLWYLYCSYTHLNIICPIHETKLEKLFMENIYWKYAFFFFSNYVFDGNHKCLRKKTVFLLQLNFIPREFCEPWNSAFSIFCDFLVPVVLKISHHRPCRQRRIYCSPNLPFLFVFQDNGFSIHDIWQTLVW